VPGYLENAELLGPRRSLLAIATSPQGTAASSLPAVVFLNTGIVHRIGHNRMYVTFARLFAARGHVSARFDASGIGDTPPRTDGTQPVQAFLEDIRTVLDWLQDTQGVERVVLMGLCSGADHAVLYAHTDPRVVGLVLMDPTVRPTARYYFHYVVQRIGRLENWISVLSGRSGLMKLAWRQLRIAVKRGSKQEDLVFQDLGLSPYLRHCYRRAAEMRTRLLTVFTSISVRQTYQRQVLDAFPEANIGGSLRLEYFPESDHLFSRAQDRTRLHDVVLDWLGKGFPR
jgi:pimeloyl-ACP methyl ester carboxylesterase